MAIDDTKPYLSIPELIRLKNEGLISSQLRDTAENRSDRLKEDEIEAQGKTLEVGYSGDVYHAWISCYVDEIGWVDNIIEFDGKNWSIMDPTLAANNSASDVKKYVGNGKNYVTKYTY